MNTGGKRRWPNWQSVRLAVPIVLTILAGHFAGSVSYAADAAPGESPPPVRGVVRPRTQASISSDLAVAVRRAPFLEGQRFKKGDLLVAFDCRRFEAEYEAAKAQHHEAQLTAENSAYLLARKALGKFDFELALARVAKAAAGMAAVSVRLDQCTISAPYDGRVTELLIREHETPAPGRPMITVIADNDLEIELIIPSQWLSWIEAGETFTFHIDETQGDCTAEVSRLGAAVDPVSQTVKAVGRFQTTDSKILAGMSGTARFGKAGN